MNKVITIVCFLVLILLPLSSTAGCSGEPYCSGVSTTACPEGTIRCCYSSVAADGASCKYCVCKPTKCDTPYWP